MANDDWSKCPSTITNDIASDLWPDILKRLPVKTLMKIRCVCKSWKCLIDSPLFSTLQLEFTTSRTEQILIKRFDSIDENFLEVINGVVCLISYLNWKHPQIGFWNPTIGKYVSKPFPSSNDLYDNYMIGFGFNRSKNDFKAVWSPLYGGASGYYRVFSARDGMWGPNKAFPQSLEPLYYQGSKSCFFNGRIHWVLFTDQDLPIMLVFDCERDECSTMLLPRLVCYEPTVLVYGGLLSLAETVLRGKEINGSLHWIMEYDIWTMTEYGVASTWIKTHTFQYRPNELDDYVFEESLLLMDIGNPCQLL